MNPFLIKLAIHKRKDIAMVILGILLIVAIIFLLLLGGNDENCNFGEGETKGLSSKVESYRALVTKYAKEFGGKEGEKYVPYLLAKMEVETHGQGGDPMQSSESLGLPPNAITNPNQSIMQGTKFFLSIVEDAKDLDVDIQTIIQSYNFGRSYIYHISKNGGKHTREIAKKYSREVVAPSLGNVSGETYPHVNDISGPNGFLYTDGGDYYYAEKVMRYVEVSKAPSSCGGSGGKVTGGNFAYPLPEKIDSVSGFEWRPNPTGSGMQFHKGLDFAVPSGTEIYSSEKGTVRRATDVGDGYGINVVIEHSNGMWTRYAHMSKTAVKEGKDVTRNQVIGYVGSTGDSTGPHLHYEVLTSMYDGHVDPRPYIGIGK